MKQKKIIIIISLVLLIIVLIGIGRVTQLAYICRINDDALAPSHKRGSFVMVSRLKDWTRHSNVIISLPNSNDHRKLIRRIAGIEGDTLEFNDGYLLGNGIIADNPNEVTFNYYVNKQRIKNMELFDKVAVKTVTINDTIIVSANYNEYTELSRHIVLRKLNNHKPYNDIITVDPLMIGNTKPFVVPKGFCFVLADNRDNADDSRQWGYIPVSSIKATVIGSH